MDIIKKSFILYTDSLKTIQLLSDTQAGVLFKKIYEQIQTPSSDIGITIDDLSVRIAFINIQNYLSEDLKKYQNVVERNRANGKKGGRPQEPNGTQKTQVVNSETQNNPNNLDTDTELDTELELGTGNEINILATPNEVTPTKSKKFIKPTVEEITAYCNERGNKVNANKFFDYYESKGWLVGKSPMKDWKACVRTWERNTKDNYSQPVERISQNVIF